LGGSRCGKRAGQVGSIKLQVNQVRVESSWPVFFKQTFKKKITKTNQWKHLERMNKINQRNELHLMPPVNILPILTVLSVTKILYSNEFMMKKSSILITHYQNACNYKFTTSERDRSPNINGSIFLPLYLNILSLFFFYSFSLSLLVSLHYFYQYWWS